MKHLAFIDDADVGQRAIREYRHLYWGSVLGTLVILVLVQIAVSFLDLSDATSMLVTLVACTVCLAGNIHSGVSTLYAASAVLAKAVAQRHSGGE